MSRHQIIFHKDLKFFGIQILPPGVAAPIIYLPRFATRKYVDPRQGIITHLPRRTVGNGEKNLAILPTEKGPGYKSGPVFKLVSAHATPTQQAEQEPHPPPAEARLEVSLNPDPMAPVMKSTVIGCTSS